MAKIRREIQEEVHMKLRVGMTTRMRHDGIDGKQLTAIDEDDVLATERFESSHKPFIAFCVVCVLLELICIDHYPITFTSLRNCVRLAIAGDTVNAIFRWYSASFDNYGAVRWLFGWMFVTSVIFTTVISVAICSSDIQVNPVAVVGMMFFVLKFWFLAVSGIPSPCRMVALFVYAVGGYSLPLRWKNNGYHYSDTAMIATTLTASMLLGDLTGRLWVRHNERSNVAGRKEGSRSMQLSYTSVVPFCVVSVLAFLHQWHNRLDDQLDSVVIYGEAPLWLLIFTYLKVVHAPWFAHWMTLGILKVSMPLLPSQALLIFVGVLTMGEVAWLLWVQLPETTYRGKSDQGVDEAQEQSYRAQKFDESYSTTTACCVVGMLAVCARTVLVPGSFARALMIMASWGGVFGLRFHNRKYVPLKDRAAHFGVRVTIMHFVYSVIWVALEWNLYPEHNAPPAIFAGFLFAVTLFIVYCKWMCLPDRYRLVMIVVTMTAFAAIAPFSKLGRRTEMYGLVATMLFAEFMAYILFKERRSTHFKTNSLRQKVYSSKGQLKLAMDTTLSAACVADRDMNLEYANPAMAKMFGYTPDQLKGQNVDILLTASGAKTCAEFVKAFLQTNGKTAVEKSREIQGKHKNGHTLDLRVTLNTDPDKSFYVASFLDLAAEKSHRELKRKLKHHTLLRDIYATMPGV